MKSLFFCQGIGDAIACDSILTIAEKLNINKIVFATPVGKLISGLFKNIQEYGNAAHVFANVDFSKHTFIAGKDDFLDKYPGQKEILSDVSDSSFEMFLKDVACNIRHYQGSSFLIQKLANISYMKLPSNYISITPFTVRKLVGKHLPRDLDRSDWVSLLSFLMAKSMYGVILNNSRWIPTTISRLELPKIPQHKLLIDLTNKTTVKESIEVLKGGKGYWGIDSFLTVLAVKLFSGDYLKVKNQTYINTSNEIDCNKRKFYFFPKNEYKFLVTGFNGGKFE